VNLRARSHEILVDMGDKLRHAHANGYAVGAFGEPRLDFELLASIDERLSLPLAIGNGFGAPRTSKQVG